MSIPTIAQKYRNHELPRWDQKSAAWYETAQKAVLAGKIILIIGLVLTSATIGGSLLTSGTTMIAIAVVGGTSSLVAFSFGIYFVCKKEYWNDPVYKMGHREEIIQCLLDEGYEAAALKYRAPDANLENKLSWDRFHEQLISTDTIREIILQEIWCQDAIGVLVRIDADVRTPAPLVIAHGIMAATEFTAAYVEEIKRERLSFSQFIQRHGWQIFKDGRVSFDTQIEGDFYMQNFCQDSFRDYQTLGDLHRSFQTLFDPLRYKLVAAPQLRPLFLAELSTAATFDEIYDRITLYSTGSGTFWQLFSTDTSSFATTDDLRSRAINCFIENSFQVILNKYGWKLFEHDLVSFDDTSVQESKRQYLNNMTFTQLLESGSMEPLQQYHLLDPREQAEFSRLKEIKSSARANHQQAIERAQMTYGTCVRMAGAARDYPISAAVNVDEERLVHTETLALPAAIRRRHYYSTTALGQHYYPRGADLAASTVSIASSVDAQTTRRNAVLEDYRSTVSLAERTRMYQVRVANNQYVRDTSTLDYQWSTFRARHYQ